jgi:hypothetical protein
MANLETQIVDDILLKSRRKLLTLGAASIAGMAIGAAVAPKTAAMAASYTDADILNFALNLEYLEANFYYMAAFGTTITTANALSTAAGAPVITLSGTVGSAGNINVAPNFAGATKVPFAIPAVAAYATETAAEEGKHVKFLLGALGSATAVAQPLINLSTALWQIVAGAAGVAGASSFNPYGSDAAFLVGAYVFEDVGVTAYHGAASLLTSSGNLSAAAGILAVEAYHAGLVRTTINAVDPLNTAGYLTITQQISALRATLASAALFGATPATFDPSPDDYGLVNTTVSLANAAAVPSTRIVDCDLTASDAVNSICFARNTAQVLNIVTAGGAVSSTKTQVTPATGGFFTNGLNAGPNGFR